jgi:putative transposase
MEVLYRRCVVRGRGRRVLRDLATIVTPDTILRWHRQVIARKSARGPTSDPYGTPRHLKEIEHLTGRMANEHSRWDATRIQGAAQPGARSGAIDDREHPQGHGIEPAPTGRRRGGRSWCSVGRHRSGELLDHRRVDATRLGDL